jgi:hypothetical protein
MSNATTNIDANVKCQSQRQMPMSNATTNIDANINANVKCQYQHRCQHQCQRQMPIPTSRQRSMTNTTPIDQCNARLCGFHRDIQLEISNTMQRNAMHACVVFTATFNWK